jgi:hypothetical protein
LAKEKNRGLPRWRSLGERKSLSNVKGLSHSLGSKPGIDLQCVSGEPPKRERESAAGRTVTIDLRRFTAKHADMALSANLASRDFVQIAVATMRIGMPRAK